MGLALDQTGSFINLFTAYELGTAPDVGRIDIEFIMDSPPATKTYLVGTNEAVPITDLNSAWVTASGKLGFPATMKAEIDGVPVASGTTDVDTGEAITVTIIPQELMVIAQIGDAAKNIGIHLLDILLTSDTNLPLYYPVSEGAGDYVNINGAAPNAASWIHTLGTWIDDPDLQPIVDGWKRIADTGLGAVILAGANAQYPTIIKYSAGTPTDLEDSFEVAGSVCSPVRTLPAAAGLEIYVLVVDAVSPPSEEL